jgi:hypothetical protein
MESDSERIAAAALSILQAGDTWTAVTPLCMQVRDALGRKRLSETFVHQVYDVLDDLLTDGALLDRTDAADLPEYALRDRFFEGKRFLVRLTPFEAEKGLLAVGHRFVPFVHADVALGEVVVLFEGKALARRQTRMAIDDSAVYCTLLGKIGWIEHLIEVNGEEAVLAAMKSNSPICLPTLDLGPVLKRHPGASGFLIECVDHYEGVLQVVGVQDSAAPVDFQGTAAACRALDAAFAGVFAEWEPESISIPEQMALAYARMPEGFFTAPPFHFGGYLALTKAVALATSFLNTTLWRRGEDPRDAINPEDREDIEGMIDALASTLQQAEGGPEASPRGRKHSRGGAAGKAVGPAAAAPTALPWPGSAADRAAGSAAQIYTLDVALDAKKRIRRRIEIHEDNSWEELHEAIFDAFDREDEHLYAFYLTFTACPSIPKRSRSPAIGPDFPSAGLSRDRNAASALLGDDTLNAKDKLYYLFDFGDEWWHEITVVSVEARPGAQPEDYPRLVDSKGASPPQYPLPDEEE